MSTAEWGLIIACALSLAWIARQLARAPRGCDACDGIVDCPNCGPLNGRPR